VVVLTEISNSNTSISKIIDLIRPVNEWAEIAFSASQNAENEHCVTPKKLVHKLNFQSLDKIYKTLNVVYVYYYFNNLSLQWERVFHCRYN